MSEPTERGWYWWQDGVTLKERVDLFDPCWAEHKKSRFHNAIWGPRIPSAKRTATLEAVAQAATLYVTRSWANDAARAELVRLLRELWPMCPYLRAAESGEDAG